MLLFMRFMSEKMLFMCRVICGVKLVLLKVVMKLWYVVKLLLSVMNFLLCIVCKLIFVDVVYGELSGVVNRILLLNIGMVSRFGLCSGLFSVMMMVLSWLFFSLVSRLWFELSVSLMLSVEWCVFRFVKMCGSVLIVIE